MRASKDMYIQRVTGIQKDISGHVRIYRDILDIQGYGRIWRDI